MADIADKWRTVETAISDRQYLDLCGHAFIAIDAHGHGKMAFGALVASFNCGFTPSGIDFDLDGADEGNEISRDAWGDLQDDGCLEGEILFNHGDETTFTAVPWEIFSAPC